MNFRKSQMEDVDRILELIKMAESSLKEMGIDQWQNGYPNREKIENDVNKGIIQLVEKSIHSQFTHIGGHSLHGGK